MNSNERSPAETSLNSFNRNTEDTKNIIRLSNGVKVKVDLTKSQKDDYDEHLNERRKGNQMIERVVNVWGSTAGAGSDFLDIYRKHRYTEMERLKKMDEDHKQKIEYENFQAKREAKYHIYNEISKKKRMRRKKRKEIVKKKGNSKNETKNSGQSILLMNCDKNQNTNDIGFNTVQSLENSGNLSRGLETDHNCNGNDLTTSADDTDSNFSRNINGKIERDIIVDEEGTKKNVDDLSSSPSLNNENIDLSDKTKLSPQSFIRNSPPDISGSRSNFIMGSASDIKRRINLKIIDDDIIPEV